jgi:triosephosphate isomerase
MKKNNRPFVVAANWKMHKSPREAGEFLKSFVAQSARLPLGAGCEVVFFVPAINLLVAAEILRESKVKWGAQNCYFELKGAFTGENSPAVLAEIGAGYALVGHSERRALFHETDADTGKKVKALHGVGILPMLCVGETLNEREAGRTNEVILRQLRAGLEQRDLNKKVVVAYEPVWAIGTGKVATPLQVNEAHLALRQGLKDLGGEAFANATPILYGGGVKPENAAELGAQAEIDGFLVGGASLEIASFLALCSASAPGHDAS